MNKIILAALIISLSGCAQTYEQLRAAASSKSTDYLCMVSVSSPKYSQIADDELTARGAKCDWQKVQLMMQAHQMQQAQYNQQMQAGMATMLNAQKPVYLNQQPQRGFNCYTWGNQTSCQ